MLAQKNFGAKMENMLENQTNQREVLILISLLFITLFIWARRARVILLQCLISVVKGNPQDILLFSYSFQAPDDKTFP